MLLTAALAALAADSVENVNIKIAGANLQASRMDPARATAPSYFFQSRKTVNGIQESAATPTAYYAGIYPGIDLVTYGDDYQIEYVFVLAAGSDPSLIRLAAEGVETIMSTRAGTLVMPIPRGEILQGKPVAFFTTKSTRESIDADYLVRSSSNIGFRLGREAGDYMKDMNNTRMNIIPAAVNRADLPILSTHPSSR